MADIATQEFPAKTEPLGRVWPLGIVFLFDGPGKGPAHIRLTTSSKETGYGGN